MERNTKHFKLHKMGYDCQNCGSIVHGYGFIHYTYGEFFLYNKSNLFIYWSTAEDTKAFDEVSRLLAPMLSTTKIQSPEEIKIFQGIMGICCDKIGEDSTFRINPQCHVCGSLRTKFGGPNVPYESAEFDVDVATHTFWESLNETQKRELVREALNELAALD